MPQLLDTSAAPVAGHAAGVVVPKLDLGALHPQAVGVAGGGAGTCGAVAYLLAGGSAATGVPMGSSQAPLAPSGASAGMADACSVTYSTTSPNEVENKSGMLSCSSVSRVVV